jgi:hypothetical protein
MIKDISSCLTWATDWSPFYLNMVREPMTKTSPLFSFLCVFGILDGKIQISFLRRAYVHVFEVNLYVCIIVYFKSGL